MTRVCLDSGGRWSGGGLAVLQNLRMLDGSGGVLLVDSAASADWLLVPRNYAHRSPRSGRLLLMPQNAWPWSRPRGGPRELATQLALRVASEWGYHQAHAILRIGSAIPVGHSPVKTSPVIPNVLDRGFESIATDLSEDAAGEDGVFLAVGSFTSYRNFDAMLDGYAAYLERGGSRPLDIIGRATFPSVYRRVLARISSLSPAPRITTNASRRTVVHAMRRCYAVALPSLVEASPIAALEAAAVNRRLMLSDIPGHRDLPLVSRSSTASPRWVKDWAKAFLSADRWVAKDDYPAASPAWRETQRDSWVSRVSAFVSSA